MTRDDSALRPPNQNINQERSDDWRDHWRAITGVRFEWDTAFDRVHPADKERVMGGLVVAKAQHRPFCEEYRLLDRNGTYVLVRGQALWMFNDWFGEITVIDRGDIEHYCVQRNCRCVILFPGCDPSGTIHNAWWIGLLLCSADLLMFF